MTTPLEHDLTRAMTVAAEAAPSPEPGFFAAVGERRRQRRRRRLSVVAAAAAVVILGATFGLFQLVIAPGTHSRPPTGSTPSAMPTAPVPRLRDAVPAEQLWPQAVRPLPGRLPDGRAYILTNILDGGSYLVSPIVTGGSGQTSGELLRWEPATGSTTLLGKTTSPPGYAGMAPAGMAAVGAGHVAWIMAGWGNPSTGVAAQSEYQEIWVATLDGSQSSRVAVVKGGPGVKSPLHIVAGDVVWSQISGSSPTGLPQSSLHRVPLSGGEAAAVPGGEGYTLLATAPWAQKGTEEYSGSEQWNLADGTRRPVTASDYESFRCSLTWCVGQVSGDNTGWNMFVQRPDGSGTVRTDFTGIFYFTTNDNVAGGTASANGVFDDMHKAVLWDIPTGQLGTFTSPPDDPATSRAFMPYRFGPGGQLIVIDLAAIG